MRLFTRLFWFNPADKKSRRYRLLPIGVFISCGLVSVYLFFLVTRLPALDGASDHVLLVAISFAWVLIFPLWISLFLLAMRFIDGIHGDKNSENRHNCA